MGAGGTGKSWLEERAVLPDRTLLSSRRCSAFSWPALSCEAGPAGPAPAFLPSLHHLPMAGGPMRAARALCRVWRLGEESRDGHGNKP